MSNWAIVAIPKKDDYVWKISSEKIPHITLLILGDQTGNQNEVQIAEFVKHVADSTLPRFGLNVDRRDTLGPKDADVLFFKSMFTKQLQDVRADLLAKLPIKEAYLSTDQYPEWLPHLTLGFPETPAKADDRDYPGINWIEFDRLAFWTDDYSGYEFELESDQRNELAMSDDVENFLAHFGVLGMKWGKHLPGKNRVSVKAAPESRTQPHEDAVKAKVLSKTAKTTGTSTLSNKDLQTLITRQNLEQQYSRLNPNSVKQGNNHVKEVLAIAGTVTAGYALYESPVGKIARNAIRRKLNIRPKNTLF